MNTPTLNKMVKAYLVSAEVERLKCGRPGKSTVQNTLLGVRKFRSWINQRREQLSPVDCADEFPLVSVIRPPLIHRYLADLLQSGIKPLTAMTYVCQLQQLFAKWMRPYYEDRGWKIPPFPSIGSRPAAPRYCRPASDRLALVKRWYKSLPTGALWFAATMMLEFAMRNSDILRLKRDNFVEHNGRIYLNYTPHKTAHSSGRIVKWPVHTEIWNRIKGYTFDYSEETFTEINRIMRGLGFNGSKGAYELRKICIDHVYQKYGAEMAVSISGDNIKTIMHYYADPSQPNIGNIRIIDLL